MSDYSSVDNPDSWFSGGDKQDAFVESTKHFTYKHSTMVFLIFLSVVTVCISIVGSAFGAHIYFRAQQAEDSYDDLDVSLVVDETNKTAILSNSCFECYTGAVYDARSSTQLPGDQFRLRFKGRLRLGQSQTDKIQFPNGVFIGNMASILFKKQDITLVEAFVRMVPRNQFTANEFAPARRLATWTTFSSPPKSTYSVVPATASVDTGDTTTGLCGDRFAKRDGSVYGAYNSGGAKAVCTCLFDTTTTNSPATEYCMDLATNNPA